MPILSKTGCNAAACHSSQYGKGGFKLSVFGFAPDEDYKSMAREWRGRRIDVIEPEKSLMLLKPTLAVPHGGNRRLTKGSVEYNVLAAWIGKYALGRPTYWRAHIAALTQEGGWRYDDETLLSICLGHEDEHLRAQTGWAFDEALNKVRM